MHGRRWSLPMPKIPTEHRQSTYPSVARASYAHARTLHDALRLSHSGPSQDRCWVNTYIGSGQIGPDGIFYGPHARCESIEPKVEIYPHIYIYIYILANWPVVLFPRSNFFLRTQSINRAGGSPRPNRSHCSGRDPPTTRIRSRSIGKLIELIRTSDPTTRLVFELDKCQKRPIPRIFNWGRDVYCIEMEV